MKNLLLFLYINLVFFSCKSKTENSSEYEIYKVDSKISAPDDNPSKYLITDFNPKSNSRVFGKVRFVQVEKNLIITAKLSGLNKGEYSIHLHENSDCSSSDGKSAGDYWDNTNKAFDKKSSKPENYKGLIKNFIVNNEKAKKIKYTTDRWCIGCKDESMDILGKSLIIHKGFQRISCAEIVE